MAHYCGRDATIICSRDFTIIVIVSPDQTRAVVVLAGELDMPAWPDLAEAIEQLTATAPDTVTVDVGAVSYVGSVLPNFLVQLRQSVPALSVLTVSRPTRWARFVLRVTDMALIAEIDDELAA